MVGFDYDWLLSRDVEGRVRAEWYVHAGNECASLWLCECDGSSPASLTGLLVVVCVPLCFSCFVLIVWNCLLPMFSWV